MKIITLKLTFAVPIQTLLTVLIIRALSKSLQGERILKSNNGRSGKSNLRRIEYTKVNKKCPKIESN